LTIDNFGEHVLDSEDLWLVEFYAPWCAACKEISKEVETIADRFSGTLKVGAVNAEDETDLATHYNIEKLPTFFFFGFDKGEDATMFGKINNHHDLYH